LVGAVSFLCVFLKLAEKVLHDFFVDQELIFPKKNWF